MYSLHHDILRAFLGREKDFQVVFQHKNIIDSPRTWIRLCQNISILFCR